MTASTGLFVFLAVAGLVRDGGPENCPRFDARNLVLLPPADARAIPLNASIWVLENPSRSGLPVRLADETSSVAVDLDVTTHATLLGTVLQLTPTQELEPEHDYRIDNNGERQWFVAGDRRDTTPPTPPTNIRYAFGYRPCEGPGTVVTFDPSESNSITFSEYPDGVRPSFGERSTPLLVPRYPEENFEFTLVTYDIVGQRSASSEVIRTEQVVVPMPSDGCTCTASRDETNAPAWLLVVLVITALRRTSRRPRRR
ncbi:MAG: hypothetical protein RMA76_43725 [Deltaproteobacteria bacterium]|jgi:hypothetical protein